MACSSCAQLLGAARFRELDGDGRAERRARSLRHRDDPVREQQRFVDVVRNHDGRDRTPGLRAEARQLLLKARARQRVERAERLVEKQHFGIGRECARDGHPLPHPARKLARPAVHRVAETDQSQIALGLLLLFGPRPLRTGGVDSQPDVLDSREPREQRVILKHDRRLSRDAVATALPSMLIVPLSARITPASMFSSVDFPHPMKPTIETNSPRSTDMRHALQYVTRAGEPNDFESPCASMNAIRLRAASLRPCPSCDRAGTPRRRSSGSRAGCASRSGCCIPATETRRRPAFRSASRWRR